MAEAEPAASVHPRKQNKTKEKNTGLSSGSVVPKPQLGSPRRKKTGSKSVGGLRRLSTISEQEPGKLDGSHASQESWGGGGSGAGGEWTASSFSACSDKLRSGGGGGRFSSEESFQSEPGGTCGSSRVSRSHESASVRVDSH